MKTWISSLPDRRWIRIVACWLQLATTLSGTANDTASQRIDSIVRVGDSVFASTPSGIFRAPFSGGTWERTAMLESMPLGGALSGPSVPGDEIYYHAVRQHPPLAVPAPDHRVYGLYRKGPGNSPWELASPDQDFLHLLVDGSRIFAAVKSRTNPREESVLESTNRGGTWRALPPLPPNAGYLVGLIPDPDHPGLVCVLTAGIRGHVIHARDASYDWEVTREHRWRRRSADSMLGFSDPGGVSVSTPQVVGATLDTYFQYPAHLRADPRRTFFPALWIELGRRRQFQIESNVIVVASLRSTPNFHSQPGRNFVDMTDNTGFWGMVRVTPSGTAEIFHPVLRGDVDRNSPGWISDPLLPDAIHRRSLNLSELAPFREQGQYRIQIFYSNQDASANRKDEWALQVCSEIFNIEVR